jgi:bacterioferritin
MAKLCSFVHQYMYFHFHCDDQGYDLLAALFKKTAIEEMMHVERYAERILFVKGDVGTRRSRANRQTRSCRPHPERSSE